MVADLVAMEIKDAIENLDRYKKDLATLRTQGVGLHDAMQAEWLAAGFDKSIKALGKKPP